MACPLSDESPPANKPSNSLLRLPAAPLATGLNACVTAILDSRKPSCLSTSSNCLPPAVASAKALLMALANVIVLTPSMFVLLRTLSTVAGRIPGKVVSLASKSSVIGISLHQGCESVSVEGHAAAGNRFYCVGKFAWGHAPELLRRKTQHTETKADRLFPGKGRHASASPKVTAINSDAMRR